MSEDSGPVLVSVADCLLAVVLHPVASVIHLRAVVVEDLQAVLAPSLGAVCVLRLVVFDVRLFAEEGEGTDPAPVADLLLVDQHDVCQEVSVPLEGLVTVLALHGLLGSVVNCHVLLKIHVWSISHFFGLLCQKLTVF